jgi:CheY-like chemotaxis protein
VEGATVPEQHLPSGLSQEELATAQLNAIDAWNRARQTVEAASESRRLSREMRLDVNRRRAARQREHDALLARSEQMLRQSGQQLVGTVPVRAVLAHRNEWLRDRVASRLQEGGVEVVGVFADGAEASGTIVVEQPELVLVEDLLPTMPGLQVARRVRAFAPRTATGAHVRDSSGVDAFLEAGAAAVFTRRVPPDEIAEQLLHCLSAQEAPVTVS